MNHITNYLAFCLNQELFVFNSFDSIKSENGKTFTIKEKTRIRILSFSQDKNGINIIFNCKDSGGHLLSTKLPWDMELPFTHFSTAEAAYKHARFTKINLGTGLENFIFGRSPKYATKYAIEVSKKRLSSFLESKIFRNYKYLCYYSWKFDIQLTEKQEEIFLKDKSGRYVALYGLNKIKGKLPETLHNYLIMLAANSKNKDYYLEKYFECLQNKNTTRPASCPSLVADYIDL